MTKQEYYDLLVCSALDGTFPSYDIRDNQCQYRMDEHACAVGILIPDEMYCKSMENNSVYDIGLHRDLIPLGMSIDDLYQMQKVHDHWAIDGKWTIKNFLDEMNSYFDGIPYTLACTPQC